MRTLTLFFRIWTLRRKNMASSVTSKDGTKIAYDKIGHGPLIIIVGGALSTRSGWTEPKLALLLAPDFAVVNYDRRGRGDSTDTAPYLPMREVEDIEALLNEFGGSGYLYGISSGAALALNAASELGDKVRRLAIYDAAYDSSKDGRKATRAYNKQLGNLLANGQKGDAVALFMKFVGVPDAQINFMRSSEMWSGLEALAPTLAYDVAVLGEDRSVPEELAAKVTAATLVMFGEKSPPSMRETAQALKEAVPNAQLRMMIGQTHDVQPEALAPVLVEFFQ
jgi:pimeloyl-ACP methyl ester carboxylesterase